MIKKNNRMIKELESVGWDKKLPSQLHQLLKKGFYELNGCIFLSSLMSKSATISSSDFPDKTGYECFVNSIHVDDYAQSDYLTYACLFVEACFKEWNLSRLDGILQAIISRDEFGALVKLHLLRSGESWVSDNLEGYEDAMLLVDSSVVTLHI